MKNGVKTCDQYGKSFLKIDELKDHMNTHHREKLYSCTECDKMFDNTISLENHNETDHKLNLFKCEECDAKFKNIYESGKHKRAHENNSFCHTFNNFPKCRHVSSCIFLHVKAPFCAYDGRCSRPSCQYRHRYGCLEKNRFMGNNFMKRTVSGSKETRKDDARVGEDTEYN